MKINKAIIFLALLGRGFAALLFWTLAITLILIFFYAFVYGPWLIAEQTGEPAYLAFYVIPMTLTCLILGWSLNESR